MDQVDTFEKISQLREQQPTHKGRHPHNQRPSGMGPAADTRPEKSHQSHKSVSRCERQAYEESVQYPGNGYGKDICKYAQDKNG